MSCGDLGRGNSPSAATMMASTYKALINSTLMNFENEKPNSASQKP